MMHFDCPQDALQWAQHNHRNVCLYRGLLVDLTQFAHAHPGGEVILKHFQQDITQIFNDPLVHRHDPLSEDLLKSMAVGTVGSQFLEVTGFLNKQEALMTQIKRLNTEEYLQVINRPHFFGESVRLFQMDFFQMFSHTKWWQILTVYSLYLAYLFYCALQHPLSWQHAFATWTLSILLLWISTEYVLHQFLFHCQRYFPIRWLYFRVFHFCIHGIHHVLPMDKNRILFPPIMGVPISLLIFQGLRTFFPDPYPHYMVLGILSGYLIYDLCHYTMHNVRLQLMASKLRYHNRHHFAGVEGNFGVTTGVLDSVFGTSINSGYK